MIGSAFTTISPLSSRITRSTPCVDGCCGPMFKTIVSAAPVGVSTLIGISDNPQPDNLSATDNLPNHPASKSAANPDVPQIESPSNQKPRAHANSPPATPAPSKAPPDRRPQAAPSAANAPAAPTKAGGNSIQSEARSEIYP